MVQTAVETAEILDAAGIQCSIANARFVCPLDTELLREAAREYDLVVTMEENICSGGFGEHVSAWYAREGILVRQLNISLPDAFV
jgi:1-deoxy-D-xylulose-5-phosphate synthase